MNNIKIRNAQIDDISEIISVLEHNLIAYKNTSDINVIESTGFLINGFTYDDAKTAILDKENFIFLVSIENENISGYTIGCDVKKLNLEFQEELIAASTDIKNILSSKKVIYLRHIAKKSDTKYVGKGLLQTLLTQAKHAGFENVICQIAQEPFKNKASISFHEKFGFSCVGYNKNINVILGVYLRKI